MLHLWKLQMPFRATTQQSCPRQLPTTLLLVILCFIALSVESITELLRLSHDTSRLPIWQTNSLSSVKFAIYTSHTTTRHMSQVHEVDPPKTQQRTSALATTPPQNPATNTQTDTQNQVPVEIEKCPPSSSPLGVMSQVEQTLTAHHTLLLESVMACLKEDAEAKQNLLTKSFEEMKQVLQQPPLAVSSVSSSIESRVNSIARDLDVVLFCECFQQLQFPKNDLVVTRYPLAFVRRVLAKAESMNFGVDVIQLDQVI